MRKWGRGLDELGTDEIAPAGVRCRRYAWNRAALCSKSLKRRMAGVLSASFLQVMRYVGSAYLLWLAWKTAMPKAGGNSGGRAGAGFMTGFVLQFVNVKIMVYGMTAYSAFILPYHDSIVALLAGMCFLTMMGSLGTVVWAVAGASLQRVFQRHACVVNGLLGAMLVGCAWSLLDQ